MVAEALNKVDAVAHESQGLAAKGLNVSTATERDCEKAFAILFGGVGALKLTRRGSDGKHTIAFDTSESGWAGAKALREGLKSGTTNDPRFFVEELSVLAQALNDFAAQKDRAYVSLTDQLSAVQRGQGRAQG